MIAKIAHARIERFVFVVLLLFVPNVLLATPVSDGLVLWLDAHDLDTVTQEPGGSVKVWSDKSGQGNHAKQTDLNSQPRHLPDGVNGRSALRFD